MSEKNCVGPFLFRDVREESITSLPRRRFDRNFLLGGKRTNIRGTDFNIERVCVGEILDEFRVPVARTATEPVIKMADDQLFVIARD